MPPSPVGQNSYSETWAADGEVSMFHPRHAGYFFSLTALDVSPGFWHDLLRSVNATFTPSVLLTFRAV